MFNPGVVPMSPIVVECGPRALQAIAEADGCGLDVVLEQLNVMDLAALNEAALFLADACRVASRRYGR